MDLKPNTEALSMMQVTVTTGIRVPIFFELFVQKETSEQEYVLYTKA